MNINIIIKTKKKNTIASLHYNFVIPRFHKFTAMGSAAAVNFSTAAALPMAARMDC
jgi:hypothetical protein